jgi:hypothetical protein
MANGWEHLKPFGWGWFDRRQREGAEPSEDEKSEEARLDAAYLAVFNSPDGKKLLEQWRNLTVERALPANASESALRQLEGQRQFVQAIVARLQQAKARQDNNGGKDSR